jgi:hypothetical protein
MAASSRTVTARFITSSRGHSGWPAGSTTMSAAAARAAAVCSARWRPTSTLPLQNPGWVSGHRESIGIRAVLTRDSYIDAVATLSHQSQATTATTAARAKATRQPTVHCPYQLIQPGSMPWRPAACQATVLTVTVKMPLTNWTVAASASSRSRPSANRCPRLGRTCGTGSSTTAASPATSGGSMKYATLYIMNGASSSQIKASRTSVPRSHE